jgi:hypothetical protein
MGRCLIVANQTLGGAKLDRAIRDRIERGEAQFFIVVPMTAPRHESAWTGGFTVYEGMAPMQAEQVLQEDARRRAVLAAEACRRADDRLAQMLEAIRSAGGEAEGEVHDADPAVAAKHVLQDQSFDEVLVSTLPPGISRWIKMDLPSRIARLTDAPVTTVEAED